MIYSIQPEDSQRSGVGGVDGLGVEGAEPPSDCESGDGTSDTDPARKKKYNIHRYYNVTGWLFI